MMCSRVLRLKLLGFLPQAVAMSSIRAENASRRLSQ